MTLNDVPTSLDEAQYGEAIARSKRDVAAVVPAPERYRNVTFILPR